MTLYCISTSLLQQIPLNTPYTGDSHEEAEKNLFREPRFHLTSNNSVKKYDDYRRVSLVVLQFSRVIDCLRTKVFWDF